MIGTEKWGVHPFFWSWKQITIAAAKDTKGIINPSTNACNDDNCKKERQQAQTQTQTQKKTKAKKQTMQQKKSE